MSAPAPKAFSPAPRSTTARRPSSAESMSKASERPRAVAVSMALSFSGREIVTVAMAPSRSTMTLSGRARFMGAIFRALAARRKASRTGVISV